jgi:hypothetical protein
VREEFASRGTPDLLAGMDAVGVPSEIRTRWHGDVAAEHGVLGRDAVGKLGDGRVETEELEDDGKDVWELFDRVGCWGGEICC